ncbi:UDP-N-acetylmuramoyl-L-alanine--D-glutamate ligase [Oscillospiraceae bacterium OttesenSCG-928-G22]|nr:UDP-N-acetylmuramoyl-L-alanine--D-glutamate ligase [Oscillospiraceae bacterium OttesenSCG-928-G22]
MRLCEYMESLRGKRVVVCGLGVSNLPLVRLLRGAGIAVEGRDRKTRDVLGCADEMDALGVPLVLGEGYLEGLQGDVIFRSPGMMPFLPAFERAVADGAELTSEMEVFFDVCPGHIIGVTGSDGKTTTTTLLHEMLKEAGLSAYVGGNIGAPLLDRAGEMCESDYIVLELSSFQLMTMRKSPEIAVVTNVAPNHLDHHRSMDEYVEAKRNIFRYQGASDRVVLNLDNELTRGFGEGLSQERLWFSRTARVDEGVYFDGTAIFLREWGQIREVLRREDILIPGLHNVENYMAAIAALAGIVPDGVFHAVARRFQGVAHRLELIREFDGVRYYNDSIASSPTRTIAGLRSFSSKVILIAGGYDKNIPYAPLAEAIPAHVKALVLMGQTKRNIREALFDVPGDHPPISEVMSLAEAVDAARQYAEPGDVVLFSPASASFDMFKDFADRGDQFRAVVAGLK